MKKIKKIIDYALKFRQIEAEYRKYSTEEIQYFESQKVETNIVRIQMVSLVIIIIQFLHLIRNILAGFHKPPEKYYVLAEIAMILVIFIHEVIYDVWLKRNKTFHAMHKQYIFSWLLCFSCVSTIFMGIDCAFKHTFLNYYIIIAVISIVPLIGNRIHFFFMLLLLTAQLLQLFYEKHTHNTEYKTAVIFAAVFFVIGRVFYVYYMRNVILEMRYKNVQSELEIQSNRIHVLQKLTQETSFEYSFKEDKVTLLDGANGETRILYNYMDKLKHHYYAMLEEDVPRFIEAYREIIYGKKREEFEFHYKDKDGTIHKSRALFATIYEGEHPIMLIGKVYNIESIPPSTEDKM